MLACTKLGLGGSGGYRLPETPGQRSQRRPVFSGVTPEEDQQSRGSLPCCGTDASFHVLDSTCQRPDLENELADAHEHVCLEGCGKQPWKMIGHAVHAGLLAGW